MALQTELPCQRQPSGLLRSHLLVVGGRPGVQCAYQVGVRQEVESQAKKKHKDLHARLHDLWADFDSGAKSARHLLAAYTFIYGPV